MNNEKIIKGDKSVTKSEEIDAREKMDPENRNGHAPLPEGIIVSAERSGLNLVRHITESLTHMRTPGKVHIHEKGKLIFHRTHHVYSKTTSPGRTHVLEDGRDRYSKLLLLLRDPRETFVRAYKKNWNRFGDYCNNIKYFDEFKGEKKLIYYDDLICEDKIFKDIFDFFNVGESFQLEKIPFLREDAVNWYDIHQQKGGGSMTKGKVETLTLHQKSLTNEEIEKLALYIKKNLPEQLYYFERWNTTQWL